MKYIQLAVLFLTSACVIGGGMASSAQGFDECFRVAENGTGEWSNGICTETVGELNWVRVSEIGLPNSAGIACARVVTNGKGNWTNPACSEKGAGEKNWIRVLGRIGWFVNGTQLTTSSKAINTQLKGTAILSIPSIPFTIECKNSASEGSSIEGNGTHQGKDKGRLKYTECKSSAKECTVTEPITTNETRSYLAISGAGIVDVFEPEKGKVFAELKLKGTGCGILAGTTSVDGSVAAEVIPGTIEVTEGTFNFPETAIKTVKYEGTEREIGLKIGGVNLASTLRAAYSAKLEGGEKFAAFGE